MAIEDLKSRNKVTKSLRTKIFKGDKKIKKGCIKDKKLQDIQIYNRIGSDSAYGEAFKACYPLKCEYDIAIKKVPLNEKDLKYIKNPYSIFAVNKSLVWSELFFLKLVNLLVGQKICPHLPLVYGVYSCNECEFENPNILKYNPLAKNCLLIPNELADGDLKMLLTKVFPHVYDMRIYYFQIFMGIYCIKKYYGIYHNDLHWGNVLFHKIKQTGYIKYKVRNKSITIPILDYLMVIWDFGLAVIPEKINPTQQNTNKLNHLKDFYHITAMLQEIPKYTELHIQLRLLLENSKTIDDIMFNFIELLQGYININKKQNIIETYDTNKNLRANLLIKPFINDTNEKLENKMNMSNKIGARNIDKRFIPIFMDIDTPLNNKKKMSIDTKSSSKKMSIDTKSSSKKRSLKVKVKTKKNLTVL